MPDAELARVTALAKHIVFQRNTGSMGKGTSKVLDELAGAMKAFGAVQVTITAHTDNRLAPESSTAISQAQADAAKKYLVSQGIAATRITAIGQGSSAPVADNKSSAGRDKNRRVELVLQNR
jgi:outer membrane protein OmpA-like peptidoglycan-associated protein